MNELFERVASQIDYPCFVQGSASKGALLKKFRNTPILGKPFDFEAMKTMLDGMLGSAGAKPAVE